ncbi:MAG: hypothetical protein ACYC6B_04400 [Thermoleophilia bacterium]
MSSRAYIYRGANMSSHVDLSGGAWISRRTNLSILANMSIPARISSRACMTGRNFD